MEQVNSHQKLIYVIIVSLLFLVLTSPIGFLIPGFLGRKKNNTDFISLFIVTIIFGVIIYTFF